MIRRCDENSEFQLNILFSGGANFSLNGLENRHNYPCSQENLHWISEDQKEIVWAGITKYRIINFLSLELVLALTK